MDQNSDFMPEQTQTPPPASGTPSNEPNAPPTGNAIAEIMAAMNDSRAFVNGQPAPKPDAQPAPAAAAKPEPAAPAEKPKPVSAKTLPDPTATEQSAAAQAPDDDDEPKNLSAELKPNWKRLREEKKSAQRELETLRAEVAKSKNGNGHSDEWLKEKDTMVKEREDLLNRLRTSAIERDPRFQAYFTNRETFLVDQAKKIGGEHGQKLAAVLAMPDGDSRSRVLDEILGDLPLSAQGRVGAIVNDIDRLRSEKEQELSKASQTFQAMQEKQQADQREFNARASAMLEDTLKKWSDPEKGLPVFQSREGDAEWNAKVENAKSMARHIYGGQMSIEEKGKASLWAAAAPLLLQELNATKAEIAALKKEQGKLKAAQPGTGAGQGHPSAEVDDIPDDMPLHLRISRQAAKAGAYINMSR